MQNTDMAERDFFPNEVNIQFYVLGMMMMHRFGREVHCGNVVAVHHHGVANAAVKLQEQLP